MTEEIKPDEPVMPTFGTMKKLVDRDKELAKQVKPVPPSMPVYPDRAFRYGIVTTTIPARSGFNLGTTGRVKIHYDKAGVLTPYPGLDPVPCRNVIGGTNGPIVVGKWVIMGIVDGSFAAFVAEC